MRNTDQRQVYRAPALLAYGRLEAITSGLDCDLTKEGSSLDDVTYNNQQLSGDPVCDE